MVFTYNPNDPMSQSIYLESFLPTIDKVLAQPVPNVPSAPIGPVNPNGPKLAPQPTKDSWYYSNDGRDDGKISTFEKLKAFIKGGTYNMVRGLFCDKDGFSFKRTLATAAGAAAIALTGPIGAAVAGGVGLLCAFDNFNNSKQRAKFAMTDQEAREAYEGIGESATTAGLSLWGGFKGAKAIKNNFAWAKANKVNVPLKAKLMKWDVSRWFKPTPVNPNPTNPTNPTNPVNPNNPQQPVQPAQPQGNGQPNPNQLPPPNQPPVQPTNPAGAVAAGDVAQIGNIDASTYYNEWAPTGEIPKPQAPEYFNEWAPTGEITQAPKPVPAPAPEYFSETAPTGSIPKYEQPNVVSDWAPVGDVQSPKAPINDVNIEPDGHFFG